MPGGPRPDPHAAHGGAGSSNPCAAAATRAPSRLPWAEIFRRVFREDLLVCPRCAGGMRVLAAITDPAVVGAILVHLALPTEPPALAPARAPPQREAWPGALDPVPGYDDVFDGDAFINA